MTRKFKSRKFMLTRIFKLENIAFPIILRATIVPAPKSGHER